MTNDELRMLLKIIHAEYLKGYEIWLAFNNGETGTVNLESELWGEVFLPLKAISKFKDFKLNNGTIEWSNGADLAPEYLYELLMKTHKALISK